MPGLITELSESQIIADLLAEQRRLRRALASSQLPTWTYDTFTAPATYQLTSIPYGINGLADNGVTLSEGTDYTVNYTTGLVTFSVARTAGHVIFVSYVTTGDLVALSGTADTGAISDDFNRADNASSLGVTSVGGVAWTPIAAGSNPVATWGVNTNQAYASALGAGIALAVIDASTPDVTFQFTLATFNNTFNAGGLFRVQNASNYWAVFAQTGLVRNNSGAFTTTTAFTFTQADVMTVVLSGSSITVKKNGTTVATATDSWFTSATQFGLYSENTAHRFDNFSVQQ